MAAFRAAASGGDGQSTAVSSLDVVTPATAQDGDAAVLTVEILSTARAVTTPTGWTLISGPDAPGGSSDGESYVYTRQLTALDPGDTVTLSITGGTTRALAHMLVFSDATVTGAAIGATIDTASTSSLATPILPDVPVGSAVICLLNRRRGGTPAPSLTLPSGGGYTSSAEIATAYGSTPELCLEGGHKVATSTGDVGGEIGSSSTNTVGVNYLIALSPSFTDTGLMVNSVDDAGVLVRYSAYYVDASGDLVQVSSSTS
jgi:hypothetical protein